MTGPQAATALGYDLYAEFADGVEVEVEVGPILDELVRAEFARLGDARIREFVPIFVRRRVRAHLRQLVVTEPRARLQLLESFVRDDAPERLDVF